MKVVDRASVFGGYGWEGGICAAVPFHLGPITYLLTPALSASLTSSSFG
jgi:hypothetical protein